MSKNFPYIRYHGNMEAGVRHTKRGMYELFRAQELQERMGVPIYKRSVEVNEYTSITVQISMEQTFIHIYSNPPQLPENVPEPPVSEPTEVFRCPSAFIIRQLLDHGSPDQKHDGYVIAYNHTAKKWGIAKFEDNYGNTVPKGGNLGWYHSKGDTTTGSYTPCDVVTWNGQSGPSFHPVSHMGGTRDDIIGVGKYVYFQGRAFYVGSYVFGACILQENDGTDYMYVHTGVLREEVDNVFSIGLEYFRRIKLSSLLAGSTNFQIGAPLKIPEGIIEYGTGRDYLYAPRATDYVDENGFAYLIREYDGEDTSNLFGWMAGMMLYLKVNMRDGVAEVLYSTAENPLWNSTVFTGGYDFPEAPGTGNAYNNTGSAESLMDTWDNPMPFYVYPGTQDLYLLSLATYSQHSAIQYDNNGSPSENGANAWASSGTFRQHLLTQKNGKIIDKWLVSQNEYAFNMDTAGGFHGNATHKSTWILEYHPEMPKNKIFIEYKMLPVGTDGQINVVTLFKDKAEITLGIREHPARTDPKGRNQPPYAYGISPGFVEQPLSGEWTGAGSPLNPLEKYHENSFSRDGSGGSNRYLMWWKHLQFFPVAPPDDRAPSLGQIWPNGEYPDGMSPYLGDPLCEFKIGTNCGIRGSYPQAYVWGSTVDFYLKNIADGEDDGEYDGGPWMVNAYAIHKPVDKSGEKPYLRLRRDVNPSSSFYMTLPLIDYDPNDIRNLESPNTTDVMMSDADPGTYATLLDFYADNPYGNSISPGWKNMMNMLLWTRPAGSLSDLDEDPDKETTHWKGEKWELLSNFTSAEVLNKMTKEIGNAFFNIGII